MLYLLAYQTNAISILEIGENGFMRCFERNNFTGDITYNFNEKWSN